MYSNILYDIFIYDVTTINNYKKNVRYIKFTIFQMFFIKK